MRATATLTTGHERHAGLDGHRPADAADAAHAPDAAGPVRPDAPACFSYLPSPIGELLLVGRPGVLEGLYVADGAGAPHPADGSVRSDEALGAARRQLEEYFAGERRDFDLTVAAAGTPWQRGVWAALCAVPYATTVSYGELAGRLGQPGAARAVGQANGANPVSIVVPCHRVIAAGGGLGGYGWGLARKRWLLEHEAAVASAGSHRGDGRR